MILESDPPVAPLVENRTDRDFILRAVKAADTRLLFDWRNDPETRRASRRQDVIDWSEHQSWLARVLTSHRHVIRIAEIAGRPVGVVRAEKTDNRWELSWTVAPNERGQGIGRRMLIAFAAELEGPMVAMVRCDNQASAGIAAAAGLKRAEQSAEAGFEMWER